MKILGAVLAGGQASRFGSDKALARLHGATLLEHALGALRPWTAAQVVCGRASAPVPVVADLPSPGLGPLGGLCGALAHADRHGFDAVLTMACDTPAMPDGMARALIAAGCAHAAEAPTAGLWPARLAPVLLRHLAEGGDRSIRRWGKVAGAAIVMPGMAVPGANTPEELRGLAGGD